jgi:hypothetical protein
MVPKIRPNGLIKYDSSGKIVLEKIERGKHHWSEERWMQKSRQFLEEKGIDEPSEFELAATTVMLYHSLGPCQQSRV